MVSHCYLTSESIFWSMQIGQADLFSCGLRFHFLCHCLISGLLLSPSAEVQEIDIYTYSSTKPLSFNLGWKYPLVYHESSNLKKNLFHRSFDDFQILWFNLI